MEIAFDNVTISEAVDIALGHLSRGERCRVVTPNAEIAYECKKNIALRDIINTSQLILPDGIGVIYAAKLRKRALKGRVPGIDFASALLAALQNTGKSVFLFGAKPGVADKAAANLCKKYPGLRIAGTHNGYYSDDASVVRAINDAKPDVLFVCLGSPKQEQFMATRGSALTATVMMGLGGSLDIFAGEVQRAPEFYQKYGLEWLYRLLTQPKRFFRMLRLPAYLLSAVFYHEKNRGVEE
ncbi:MAG: glycosyltransferase [Clostridium sp. SCN 57-10]|nr:MAG: glycosyltransferase [Clostridium sp. SCN 57-10]